ncbi:MAG: efflux RND transporter periplasmic adaptor subunit [Verrucomicrobia bacterium]|nr:efflux RND transporter periplasmic adaptor subunit [Verrucomicrobiota bacterium]
MSPNTSRLLQLVKSPWRIAGIAALVLILIWWFRGGTAATQEGTSFAARHGLLKISVLEGGSVEALASQEIRSQVRGYQGTKILSIVEEGYLVTEEDIRNGKVLVELDNSELRDRITTQEIQYQSTLASLVEAKQAYDIQLNQNISDIKAAELKVRFARMDLEKFLGADATRDVLDKLDLYEKPFTNQIDFSSLLVQASSSLASATNGAAAAAASPASPIASPLEGSEPAAGGPSARQPGSLAAGPGGRAPSEGPAGPGFGEGRRPPGGTNAFGPGGMGRPRRGMGGTNEAARAEFMRRFGGTNEAARAELMRRFGGGTNEAARAEFMRRLGSGEGELPGGGADFPGPRRRPPGGMDLAANLPGDASAGAIPSVGPVDPLTAPAPAGASSLTNLLNSTSAGNLMNFAEDSSRMLKATNALVDFSQYATEDRLGDGAAKQQLRTLTDNLMLSTQELMQAEINLNGTRRLFSSNFISKTELDNQELSVRRSKVKTQSADTALDLFIRFELTKSAEEFLSKYDEALRMLERTRKEAISKLAQSRARLMSAESRFRIESEQRRDLHDQLSKCVIRAERPGLVVYGGGSGGDDRRFYGSEEQIREGATVRERQSIITIPDMTQMSVRLRIHESHIKKVQRGQKARIQVDAFPDQPLTGEVIKVGVLPDSINRYMNPDMKVYVTTVAIDGTHDWLKPGMTAKVEILVKELPDVVYVPINAVFPVKGRQVSFIANGGSPEQREVEVGDYNDEFIEVKAGLREGERVLLRPPDGIEPDMPQDMVPGVSETPGTPSPASGPSAPSAPSPAPVSERPAGGRRGGPSA